jgi:hypothetical protein
MATPVTARKRGPRLANSLLSSAIAHMHIAVEFFNRPNQPHRYEIAAELAIAAWEKILKAFMHKSKIKIFNADGRTKDFNNCKNIVLTLVQHDDPTFIATHANLEITYEYRNESAHFYGHPMDAILYGLFAECVSKFSHFVRKHFNKELLKPGDLGILPVGFGRPVVPQDFLSEHSASGNAPTEVKRFLKDLHDVGVQLHAAGVAPEHSMMVTFSVALEDAKKLHRADVLVGVNNSDPQLATLTVKKNVTLAGPVRLTTDPKAPALQLKDDTIWDVFNSTTQAVNDYMRLQYPGIKLNRDYWNNLTQLSKDPNCMRMRYLDPGQTSGTGGKKMYSDVIFHELNKIYGSKQ